MGGRGGELYTRAHTHITHYIPHLHHGTQVRLLYEEARSGRVPSQYSDQWPAAWMCGPRNCAERRWGSEVELRVPISAIVSTVGGARESSQVRVAF